MEGSARFFKKIEKELENRITQEKTNKLSLGKKMENSILILFQYFWEIVWLHTLLWGGLSIVIGFGILFYLYANQLLTRKSTGWKIFTFLNVFSWLSILILSGFTLGMGYGVQKGVETGFRDKLFPILSKELPTLRRVIAENLKNIDKNQILYIDHLQITALDEIKEKYGKDNPFIDFIISNYGTEITKLILKSILSYELHKAGEEVNLDAKTVDSILDILQSIGSEKSDEAISKMIQDIFFTKFRYIMYSLYFSIAFPLLFNSVVLGIDVYAYQRSIEKKGTGYSG